MAQTPQSTGAPETYDALVIGAGFAGLYALHKLREQGLSVRVLEAGSGVGGTWYWNRYPGARCDVESVDYQYSFSDELLREWTWSERYPRQAEIQAYLDHVADRFDMRGNIQLDTRVVAAAFDEATDRWNVTTEQGETLNARFVVMATGCLSVPRLPSVEGLDGFTGEWYHTGAWPETEIDFTGKRVALIGTGSSGIQSLPVIAAQAAEVLVLQRTASYSVPAFNRELDQREDEVEKFAARRKTAQESFLGLSVPSNDESAVAVSDERRQEVYEERWRLGGLPMYGAFADLIIDENANATAADFFAGKIRAAVDDPAVADKLVPSGYPFGGKRICVDTDYFETFNLPTVRLIDLKEEPLHRISPRGVVTGGTEHEVDTIVFATGFDAMTGALSKIDVQGRDGATLADQWAAGPRTYLGLAVAGFPNMFLVTGPGSPSVFSNMVVSIEQHVDWITDAIMHLREGDASVIEASESAQDGWVDHVNAVADFTLMNKAASWYTGANIPGKPRVFMPYLGGVGAYRQKCDDVAAHDYDGFLIHA